MEKFKKRVKRLRLMRKLTAIEVARRTNIQRSTITRFETGVRLPTLEQAVTLADFFAVSLDYLLGRDNPEKDLRFVNRLHKEIYNLCASLNPDKMEIVKTLIISLHDKNKNPELLISQTVKITK